MAALQEEDIPAVNIEAAQEVNEEITAWLYSPDTMIDYPVCFGEDNTYYLNHLADGTPNANGCLFIDCRNAKELSDDNIIIYGHHMRSGAMFAGLIKYKSQEYYDEHPVMYLTSGNTVYRLELFSGYVTDMGSSAYQIDCGTGTEFADWLREISARSNFRPNPIRLTTSDHIVTLSTCAYDFQDARYVVHGRLVEIGGTNDE